MNTARSRELMERARRVIPGGVNSPVRSFRAVGGDARFIARGEGACVWDADGNRYLDYVLSWGPLAAGHAHPEVVAALQRASLGGTSYGAPTEQEIVLAERITRLMPAVEMVRLVNSGTEATMSALRLARAATGRTRAIKFAGCYHGHSDPLLVRAGSGALTLGTPDSPGVPPEVAALTITCRFNDLGGVEEAFRRHPGEIAAIIVEPVAGNMGCVPPTEEFLPGLRRLATQHGALLIFDEVMTGFRVALGGAQARYGVLPDLTCLGKVIGGGLPVGAYGGRRDLMSLVSPAGPVYQAGTLSGNPLAVAGGLATLEIISRPGAFERMVQLTERLAAELEQAIRRAGVPARVQSAGTMWTLFFAEQPVTDFDSAVLSDTARFARFFHAMLEQGVYLPPSQFEAAFLSTAHTDEDIERTVAAAETALRA